MLFQQIYGIVTEHCSSQALDVLQEVGKEEVWQSIADLHQRG